MKYLSIILFSAASLLADMAQARGLDKERNEFIISSQVRLDPTMYEEFGLDLNEIKNNRTINNTMFQQMMSGSRNRPDPLSSFEAVLPHTTEAPVSSFERAVISAYLEHPKDITLATFLALYHYQLAFAGNQDASSIGKRVSHRILAHYFLERMKDLRGATPLLNFTINANQAALDQFFHRGNALDTAENHPAHDYFYETFNYREQNRYVSLEKLFADLNANPSNAMTLALTNAASLWIGGEARYDDPTMLYNYIWSSFLSIRLMEVSKQRELAWKANPASPRFRLASLIGGWSVPARRWLAQLVNDNQAVAVLDNEHRAWRLKNRPFHAFIVGMVFFDEKDHVDEGFAAYDDGFVSCFEIPEQRTCGDAPRFSFNILGFLLGQVDFYAKRGELDAARQLLSYRYNPDFQYDNWTLGRAAWEHREQNLEQISALYRNNNPKDDPTALFLSRKKWGASTITCQLCHQAQARPWTEAEKANVSPAHESVSTIGDWPAITTNWYGGVR